MKKKPIQFKIYPFWSKKYDKKCWWTVIILKNKEEIQALNRTECKCGGRFSSEKALGFCHAHGRRFLSDQFGNPKPDPKGEIGILCLNLKNLGAEVVSHECCHAMLYTTELYTHSINFWHPNWHDTDEWMCQILGKLDRQIVQYCLDHKLYN